MKEQTYIVTSEATGKDCGEVTFPSDPSCANFFGVCFYNPATDSFLGDTHVDGYILIRKEYYSYAKALRWTHAQNDGRYEHLLKNAPEGWEDSLINRK